MTDTQVAGYIARYATELLTPDHREEAGQWEQHLHG
jgi:hypothetical protein